MSRPMRLVDLGEDRLVARLTQDLPQTSTLLTGPGDDCAVVSLAGSTRRRLLLKTDALVEGIHFLPTAPPTAVGWKAAARAVSDIAAMGGQPTHALITLIAPSHTPVSWVEGVYRGLRKVAQRYHFSLAGGETSSAPPDSPRVISISLTGEVEPRHCVLRSGGHPGDVLCVTGRLGGSLAGWHLKFTPRLAEAHWLVAHAKPTAMMDLSDGLARDLPRLAAASNVGWHLNLSALPCRRGASVAQALHDGEDFELLLALSPRRWPTVQRHWRAAFPHLPLTAIGHLTEPGHTAPPLDGGYAHFS